LLIHEALPGDIAALHRINSAAFDTETEAKLWWMRCAGSSVVRFHPAFTME